MLDDDLPNALLEFQRAVEINPEHRDSITGMAMVLTRQGQLEKAAVQFERSSDLDPSDPIGHARLGQLYMELGSKNWYIFSLNHCMFHWGFGCKKKG